MMGFFLFLLVVCAVGFIFLTFQKRWQVKDEAIITTLGANKVEQRADSITITSNNINLNGAVAYEEVYENLPKSAPRVNQVHMERRMFERPRRKVK